MIQYVNVILLIDIAMGARYNERQRKMCDK